MNNLTKGFIVFVCLSFIELYLICPPERPLDESYFEMANPMSPAKDTPPPKAILERSSEKELLPEESKTERIAPTQPIKKNTPGKTALKN